MRASNLTVGCVAQMIHKGECRLRDCGVKARALVDDRPLCSKHARLVRERKQVQAERAAKESA